MGTPPGSRVPGIRVVLVSLEKRVYDSKILDTIELEKSVSYPPAFLSTLVSPRHGGAHVIRRHRHVVV